MSHDDDTLMLSIATGDERAFRLLVARWEGPVFRFLVHMLGVEEEARDLTQDTFLKVWDRAGRYRAEGRFRSWLLRIAGNQARSLLRRRKILRWVSFDLARHDRSTADDDPHRGLERRETVARVRAAVADLPDRQREAVVLRRLQGLRYQEVAEIMQTTVPAIESLLQRAAVTLRNRLGPDLGPDLGSDLGSDLGLAAGADAPGDRTAATRKEQS